MKAKVGAIFIVGLIIGVVIGASVGYEYFLTTQIQGSWQEATSFILASTEGAMPANVEIAYSYPNIYYVNGPLFTVSADFWRVKLQTIPYYNYTNGNDTYPIYYNQAPINNIRIWRDVAYHTPPFSSLVLLDPTYDYNVSTSGTAQVNDQVYYVSWKGQYIPVETSQMFAGKGTYTISLDTGVGCFKFTIEEYR